MAAQTVEKYMTAGNRPYSLNDVVQALKDLNKSVVQKSLDQLVGKGKLTVKEYGKQKVYCAVQRSDNGGDEKGDVDSEILAAQNELERLKKELIESETKLKRLNSVKSTAEALRENAQFEEEIPQLQLKLLSLEKAGNSLTDAEVTTMNSQWDSTVKMYRKRKRIVSDILDQILEGYPKTKKHLMEEIGIDDDDPTSMPKFC